ncbi:carboxypeptidase-like regulatory domain-containing protein [Methanobrevibacter sp.]|uniref:carboxypeptidase-like regulatory domain-containing protein n=1 Tax=Methanobrevibacter sp. TaxID=66852 RepID=UPI0038697A6C
MDKNKIMIIVLIAIIAALLVGIFAMMPNTNKQDTKLTFKSDSTLDEGSPLKIKLIDANGTAIANQTVNVTITDDDSSNSYYSVVTNGKGIGKLDLDKSPGKYNVAISYGGNDQYNGCNATKKIKIEEKVVEATVDQSSSGLSSSSTHVIIGEDGYYYRVDDNGNILEHLGPSSQYYPNGVYYPDAEPGDRYIDKSVG